MERKGGEEADEREDESFTILASHLNNGSMENGREETDDFALNQRLQYYQSYLTGNQPDNMDSSDDEADQGFRERGSMEVKNQDDFDDYLDDDQVETLNHYAPLEEGVLTLPEEEEFGDFMASSIGNGTEEERMNEIDSILNTSSIDDLENNVLFGRLVRDNHRYERPIASNPSQEVQLASLHVDIQEENETVMTEAVEPHTKSQPKAEVPYCSIPPLSQERVDKIKNIMAGMKIKPPNNLGTIALLDSFEHSRFRVGDELSNSSKK